MVPHKQSVSLEGKPPSLLRVATLPVYPLSTSPPRSPRSEASHGSSHSSRYLTPPMTESEPDEVPWKPPIPGDLVSLDMHNRRKRNGKKRRHSSHVHHVSQARIIAAGRPDRFSKQVSPIGAIQSAADQTSLLTGWEEQSGTNITSENITTKRGVPSNSENRATRQDSLTEGNLKSHDTAGSLRPRSSTTSMVRDWRNPDAVRSPRATEMKTQRSSTIIGDTLQPSTSLVNVVALRPLVVTKGLPGDIKLTESGAFARRKSRKGMSNHYQDGLRRRQSRQETRLETLATITLRKASSIGQRERWLPLLGSSPEGVATAAEAGSPDSGTRRQKLVDPKNYEQSGLRYCLPLISSGGQTKQGIDRFQSAAAEPALTIAEVHPATTSYSPVNRSRRNSSLAMDTTRKSSFTQFRSRNSVVEIIWDKTDTPSTRSSNSHTTPLSEAQTLILTSISEKEPGPPSVPDAACGSRKQSKDDHADMGNIDEHVLIETMPQSAAEELIEWSWTQTVDSATLNPDEPPSIKEELLTPAPTEKKTRRGRWSKSWETLETPSPGMIESFPPLLDRQSTSDWRTAPLVDLNDPTAGRSPVAPERLMAHPKTHASVGKDDVERHVPASDSLTHTDHRTHSRQPSRVGEALGISQGQRRPPVGPSQQKSYKSLFDLTRSVSQRASEIRQNLSDISLYAKGSRSYSGIQHDARKESPPHQDIGTPPSPGTWGVEGIAVVPRWRKSNSHGLYLDTSVVQPIAGSVHAAELKEDEVEYR